MHDLAFNSGGARGFLIKDSNIRGDLPVAFVPAPGNSTVQVGVDAGSPDGHLIGIPGSYANRLNFSSDQAITFGPSSKHGFAGAGATSLVVKDGLTSIEASAIDIIGQRGSLLSSTRSHTSLICDTVTATTSMSGADTRDQGLDIDGPALSASSILSNRGKPLKVRSSKGVNVSSFKEVQIKSAAGAVKLAGPLWAREGTGAELATESGSILLDLGDAPTAYCHGVCICPDGRIYLIKCESNCIHGVSSC